MNKRILTIIGCLTLVICIILFNIPFTKKKFTRDELIRNFIIHQKDFSDLVTYFKIQIPQNREYEVTFGLGKGNTINLEIIPNVVDSGIRTIGGENLEIGSLKLDSALAILGWTHEISNELRTKLSKTSCDWIKTTQIYGGNPIEIWPNQSSWGVYSYLVFDKPLDDSLIKIHGVPLGSSDFGKRVVLDYVSAL